jgi:hypothetical protein
VRHLPWTVGLVALFATTALSPAIAAASELPKVPVASFSTPTEYLIKPAMISLGASACAPYFENLRWTSYGRTGARAEGTGIFPVRGAADCAEAASLARPRRVSIVLSSPHYCEDHLIYLRIGWRARGVHDHTVTYACRQ